jgi:hypothetical protein
MVLGRASGLIALKALRAWRNESKFNSQETSMTQFLKAVPLMAALMAAPAVAAPADQHDAHHPNDPAAGATAQPGPQPGDPAGCPGATGQSMGAHMADGHMANSQAMADYMAKNKMMGAAGGQGPGAMMGGATGQGGGPSGMMAGTGGPGAGMMTGPNGQGPGPNGMMPGGQNCPGYANKPAQPTK